MRRFLISSVRLWPLPSLECGCGCCSSVALQAQPWNLSEHGCTEVFPLPDLPVQILRNFVSQIEIRARWNIYFFILCVCFVVKFTWRKSVVFCCRSDFFVSKREDFFKGNFIIQYCDYNIVDILCLNVWYFCWIEIDCKGNVVT